MFKGTECVFLDGSGRYLDGKAGSIPALGPRPLGSRVKRKIQLEFLPHIPLTFHKDFKKPDSQPETKTLWAEEKIKTYYATISALPASKRANTEKNARASGAYGPKCASARESPAPSRSRQREARASEINSLKGSPEASAPRPAGRWSVPALAPPWRGNPPEVLISGIRGWR